MKKQYQVWGLAGALLWAGVVLIRTLALALPSWAAFLVGVAPNVGVVWVLMELFVMFFPYIRHQETTKRQRYIALGGILGILLLSEIVHAAFLGASFDAYDMLASVIAIIPMALINARSSDA